MKLERDEVAHIALLARLGLSEAELERFRDQLSTVIENFDVLRQVDTGDVPPTAYPISLENVVREDEVRPSLPQSDILANAPLQEDECFRVKGILE